MIQFSGLQKAKIDEKNRCVIPDPYKDEYKTGEILYLEKDTFTKSLNLYSEKEWEKRASLFLQNLNPFKRKDQQAKEEFFARVEKVKMADAGRIKIEPHMIDYALLKKDVVFIGNGNIVKIWDKEIYHTNKMQQQDFEDFMENVFDIKQNE